MLVKTLLFINFIVFFIQKIKIKRSNQTNKQANKQNEYSQIVRNLMDIKVNLERRNSNIKCENYAVIAYFSSYLKHEIIIELLINFLKLLIIRF